MKNRFYSKIARNNIKKNYRFFLPRSLAEAGLLAVFYIIFTLKSDERIQQLHGGEYIGIFMSIGTVVIMLLSVILMIYTNSFLMKQRKHEFGLYNVLGMEKRHIGKVLFFESAFVSIFSVLIGVCFGVLFYKVASLLICRLLDGQILLGFYYIKADTVIESALFFLLIDLATYLINRISIAKMKPLSLLKSKMTGEKEPKIKWVMLAVGVLSLGIGYYLSLSIKSPLEAMFLFFVAVIAVIIGTYFLFVSGSIFVLKALKKNKKYYYNKKHFTAVSGLLYRMKQNAVGFASICILATCVLVMISTTVSLYAGIRDILSENYPQEYYISTSYTPTQTESSDEYALEKPSIAPEEIKQAVSQAAEHYGVSVKTMEVQNYLEVTYQYLDGTMSTNQDGTMILDTYANLANVTFLTEELYRKIGGADLNLKENEIAVCPITLMKNYNETQITIGDSTYEIAQVLSYFPIRTDGAMISSTDYYGMIVANDDILNQIYSDQKEAYGKNASEYTNQVAVSYTDTDKLYDVGKKMDAEVKQIIEEKSNLEEKDQFEIRTDSLWEARESVYGMYGSLLFLGFLMGTVCLFATVLIIYYKQISEGYEDKERFQVMQKVGMTPKEVRKSINSQVILVFFLPLIAAGVHLLFAFPMLDKILHVLMLSSTGLFIVCAILVYLAFAVVYTIIYSMTVKTYYKIVH